MESDHPRELALWRFFAVPDAFLRLAPSEVWSTGATDATLAGLRDGFLRHKALLRGRGVDLGGFDRARRCACQTEGGKDA